MVSVGGSRKGGEIDYLIDRRCGRLLYVANLGCIEFHPLHSRCADIGHPDYLFFDLDPFEPYTYEDVLVVARHIKALLDQLGLPAFPKTSGATGLQIYVPVERGRLLLRAGSGLRGRVRTPDQRADPDRVDDGVEDRRPHRQDLHRPQHEPRGRQHRGRVLGAARAPGARLDPAHLGRGVRGRASCPRDFRIDNVFERFEQVGDLFDGVRTGSVDLFLEALDALDVTVDEDDAPLPRTAAPSTRARTSEEVIAASKDPQLIEYVRRRDFRGHAPSPRPERSTPAATRS